MTFEVLKAEEHAVIAQTYNRFELAIDHGQGATCYDLAGKKYIDFSSGVAVNSLGFSDPGWADAVSKQLHKLQHTSNHYYTRPYVEAAELLIDRSGMEKVFFCNSGAEANEGAVKCARKYSFDKYGPGRYRVVSLDNSFHGRTMAMLAATGQSDFHKYFDPFPQGYDHAPVNDWAATKAKLTPDVCAVMVELVQGEGGVIPLDVEYVRQVVAHCAQQDILVIVDEIQTGIGRTGTLFAYQQFDFLPDIVTSAKGLGGGLPVGAILFGMKTQSVFGHGDHGTTFGGNPAVCAGVKYVLEKLDEGALERVVEDGQYIRERLMKMPHIAGANGMGLMIGATLQGVAARDVVVEGIKRGVITLTAKDRLRLLPPLTITMEEIDEGLDLLSDALGAL